MPQPGAFSYTGKYITRRLLAQGHEVITLTGHPDNPDPFSGQTFFFYAPLGIPLLILGVPVLDTAFAIFRRESRSIPVACCATGAFIVLSWWRLLQFRPDLVSIAATLGLYRLLLEQDEPPSWRRIAGASCLPTTNCSMTPA